MNAWDDESLSIRQRLCWWLDIHEEEFTAEQARQILSRPKEKWKKTDQVSSEISILCGEGKIERRHFIEARTRVYKKVAGLDFDDLFPRGEKKVSLSMKGKHFKPDAPLPRGVKSITVHKLGW